MPILEVESLLDPRLWPYRNLKDKEIARHDRRFIAEGEQVVRRLLASKLAVESVLLARRKLPAIAPLIPPNVTAWVADDDVVHGIIGFEFHSGVMACGFRPDTQLADLPIAASGPVTLCICQRITNTENLGALIRVSAAFGVDAMLLGESCCDPYFRQAVRVSMGSVFKLPIARSKDLLADLARLRSRHHIETFATVLHADATPLPAIKSPPRAALVMGNEADGLDAQTIAACDHRITLPMRLGTDSLNVATAAAVFLYHFTWATPNARNPIAE